MVTVVVVRPDASGQSHEFLQLRRSANDDMGGTWQFVRGGVEKDEPTIPAALRELREETGLVPRELFRLSSVESFYMAVNDTLWHSIAFLAIVEREQKLILNEEHDDFRWIPRVQIESKVMWGSERMLLSDLGVDIIDNGPAKEHLRIPVP